MRPPKQRLLILPVDAEGLKLFPKLMRWTGKLLRVAYWFITGEASWREALDRGATAVAGGFLVGLGLLLIPLPGPGWFTLLVGLGLLGYEFRWAQRLLKNTRRVLKCFPGAGFLTKLRTKFRSLFGKQGSHRDGT